MKFFLEDAVFILKGIGITIQLLVGGLLIGFILGGVFSVARYNGIGRFIINRLVSIIRGTPLILQLSLIYFTLPLLTGLNISVVWAGILTFGINSSAYIAEILRAGIESIPKGQFEVSKTLKIPPYYMWKDIILPQVLKTILPALIGEVITLTKETALVATIGAMDIMRSAQVVAAAHFTYFAPLCIAGGYYYILVLTIEYIGKLLEKSHAKDQ
ncbi:putative amino acid ABC transporter permease [Candidatus Cyrtobacter comes]|uniref:Putative glutamine transport system permease protein GlnP n=1 Tax=Candidatus Cyrtobacter comes TaxID=675776 RepID=A0ABU5L857_9RICK|nr:amino acid ABC transporter permease [Candidatus Cyrtobacter comes]MDZ5762009.1 putative amino acid ABC transporter permease [Candidatus Cyrtobacter comes]